MNFFTEVRDKIVCIIFNKGVSVSEEDISVFITKNYIKQQSIFIVAMKQHFLQVLLVH
jgi:hypothetical protein